MVSTKIDLGFNKIARTRDLDELAAVLFPGNRNHQGVFLVIYVELKWAEGQCLPSLNPVVQRHCLSRRVFETVRAKMRRLGIIDHISRFSKRHGYREGWVLSSRFATSLRGLAGAYVAMGERHGQAREEKDRALIAFFRQSRR